MTRIPKADDPLLASAIRILTEQERAPFIVKPWREFMPAVNAKEKSVALKVAAKAAANKGILPPGKHMPGKPGSSVFNQQGVDSSTPAVVESGVDSNDINQGATMKPDPKAIEAAKAKADAEAKAKADRKAARDKANAEAKAKREAEHVARVAAAKEAGSKRTYFGPMTNLADKVKAGAYTKGLNGQLRSADEVALALEACSAGNVVKLLREFLVPVWPDAKTAYAELNIGQQSMNLRNKLRGFLKADEKKVTIEGLKAARDSGGYADAEATLAKRATEKAAAKKKREEDAAAKAKAKAEAKVATPVAPKMPTTAPQATA